MDHLRQKVIIFRSLDKTVDMIIIILSIRVAIICERLFHGLTWHGLNPLSFNLGIVPILIIMWYGLIKYFESDYLYRITQLNKYLKSVFFVTFLGITTLVTVEFILKYPLFYRSTLLLFAGISFVSLFIKRVIMKILLAGIRSKGKDQKHILIVGWGNKAEYLLKQIEQHSEFGFLVKHIIDTNKSFESHTFKGITISHQIDNLKTIVLKEAIDEVFFSISLKNIPNINRWLEFLNVCGVNYHVLLDLSVFNINKDKLRIEPEIKYFYGLPTISYPAIATDLYRLYIKNIWERSFAIILLFFSLPIILLATFCISLSSKGPLFFKQERVGLHARRFNLVKLRTMVNNAEELKESILDKNEQTGPIFKAKNDPRVTIVGKLLRKYSIDELPQLWNVIKGDMNLIGPRPPLPKEVELYRSDQLRRLSVKPGITGLWQVNGRNEIKDFEDWVNLDLEYIDNWSLFLDMKIALRTIPVILKGSGR